jgi:hypothetical protein
VHLFQVVVVVVASGDGGILLHRQQFQRWICSNSSFGGGLVCALHAVGVWILGSVHCSNTVGVEMWAWCCFDPASPMCDRCRVL